MKLIPNWRQAWKMYSVQAPVVNLALIGAWQQAPEDLRGYVPTWAAIAILTTLLVLGVIGRLIEQKIPPIPDKTIPQFPDEGERL